MFDYSKWVVDGVIDGYKKGERPFSKTVDFTNTYLLNGIISQEQADHIAKVCPRPSSNGEGAIND